MKNKVVFLNEHAEKRQLTDSNFYQKGLEQKKIQDILYYSNYQQLKSWLMKQIEQEVSSEEEDVYEF